MTALNSEGLEKAWRFDIQYGPDGEANYAWVYNGKDLVATMRTHYADSIVEAMNRRAPLSALPGEAEVVAWRYRVWNDSEWRYGNDYPPGSDSAEPLVPLASLQAMQALVKELEEALRVSELEGDAAFALAVDDPGKNPPVTWRSRAEAAEEANKALMDERRNLIETKRQQIEALTSRAEKAERERDEARCDPDGCKAHIEAFMSRAEAAEARVKEMGEAGQKDFRTGYLLAVANIVHTHDEPTIAEDVLMESGITRDALQEHEYCDFDLSVLRSIFTSIEARTALKGGSNG